LITQIEIDGFKTFKDFKVELAPFQVIVGPNGSGKSNLFDALRLLSRLADTGLLSAFRKLRGDAGELFTKFPDGQTSNRIRMAVEMLVDRKVQDDLGREAELKYTRLRYELEIIFYSDEHGPDQLHVAHESLKSILPVEDTWCKKYGLSSQNNWLPASTSDQATFIDTKSTPIAILESIKDKTRVEAEHPMISLYPDGDEPGRIKRFYAMEVQRTILSTEVDTDHPHVFAAREELRSLRFLHLNPEILRQPSSTKSPRFLATDGGNLPATLGDYSVGLCSCRMRGNLLE
jgi:energy-coupling factor transporter ATP-binding protein EcfA2